MKKMILAAALTIAGAAGAYADPVEGVWKTEEDAGAYAHVTMSKCGEQICGVISSAFDANGAVTSPNVGKKIVWDMNPEGSGSYKGGKIWQPSTGKIFKSKMALSGNSLKVSGCVGPFCKKQTWSRVQ
ncbi:DUF2147 domain-containing protein [Thalassobius sp. Cn5-15]|uniref:DUF2147 domain-containing protein n=1 Tax=Thalassobius sp. Cn5-15 TaxID=2917763 RepID=UPI001EF32364|nr:DUF2147 domain-containing protein [Thalassobius sp. Cn5-15]MCG7491971.1 DUF2147 domain-containing protein [Thalassobius sp. Cn5-15]